MFDLTSSKLLILGVVALIVVGPKELPFLLRTIGKYMAMIRRHANEFRSQFDEAMREAELDSIRKDLETVARDTENTIRSAQTDVEREVHTATGEIDRSLQAPAAHDQSAPSETTHVAEAGTSASSHSPEALNGLELPAHTGSTHAVDGATTDTAAYAPPSTVEPSTAAPVASELAKTGT